LASLANDQAYAGIVVIANSTMLKVHTIAGEIKAPTGAGLCADERIASRQRSGVATNDRR
jgi:hypothetical protein